MPQNDKPVTLLKLSQVCERLQIGRSAVYVGMAAGRIPRPIHVAPKAPRWRADEIDAHIEQLSERRRTEA